MDSEAISAIGVAIAMILAIPVMVVLTRPPRR